MPLPMGAISCKHIEKQPGPCKQKAQSRQGLFSFFLLCLWHPLMSKSKLM